jgi:hypothetical protein
VKLGVSRSITQEESGRTSLTLPSLGANRRALRGEARLKVSWAMFVCGTVMMSESVLTLITTRCVPFLRESALH